MGGAVTIQRVRQADSKTVMVDDFELRRGGRYGEQDESGQDLLKSSVFSLE